MAVSAFRAFELFDDGRWPVSYPRSTRTVARIDLGPTSRGSAGWEAGASYRFVGFARLISATAFRASPSESKPMTAT